MTAVDQLELTVDTSTHASIIESSTSNYLDNVRSVHFIASLKLFGDPETLNRGMSYGDDGKWSQNQVTT